MKKLLKWLGIIIGVLLVIIVALASFFMVAGPRKLANAAPVEPLPLAVDSSPASLARGEHLVDVFCRECHGEDLSGIAMIDGPPIGTIYATNISGLARHSDADIVRAIRHGIGFDGRQLMIMPSEAWIHLSEADLGAIVAYLKTVEQTGAASPPVRLQPLGKILVGSGAFDASIPATYIDHDLPFHDMPPIGATVAYGQYMTRLCIACHGPELAGDQPPDPDSPRAPNLTPGGELAGWSEADFFTALRTGVKPSGVTINPDYMPWRSIGRLTDEELRGIWLYLQSLPALPTAE